MWSTGITSIEWEAVEGASPVHAQCKAVRRLANESGCLRVQPKVGGKYHLKLNISKRPIATKYREGKMKRTLKRECKGLDIAKREAAAGSTGCSPRLRLVSASGGSGEMQFVVGSLRVTTMGQRPAPARGESFFDVDEMPVPDPS